MASPRVVSPRGSRSGARRRSLAAFAPAGVHAAACGDALGAGVARADGERCTVAWRADPAPIPVGRHFALDVEVCPRAGAAMPAKLAVDATMPAHRHGMNYAPTVTATGARPLARRGPAVPHARPLGTGVRVGTGARRSRRRGRRRQVGRDPWQHAMTTAGNPAGNSARNAAARGGAHAARLARRSAAAAIAAACLAAAPAHAQAPASADAGPLRRRGRRARRARAVAAGAGARSVEPRVRPAGGDRVRRAAVLRHAAVGQRARLLRRLPPAEAALDRRPRARRRPRDHRPQHAVAGERRAAALAGLGRRARQPVGAEPAPDLRPARDGRQRRRRSRARSARRPTSPATIAARSAARRRPTTRRWRSTPPRRWRRSRRRCGRDARRSTTSATRSRAATRRRRRAIPRRHGAARSSSSAAAAATSATPAPAFTNGEFGDIGVPFFTAPGRVDPGRHEGVKKVTASRYNLLGPWSDDPRRSTAVSTRHVTLAHRNFGEFKVPGLRNVDADRAVHAQRQAEDDPATSSATTRRSIRTGCTPTASASWCR